MTVDQEKSKDQLIAELKEARENNFALKLRLKKYEQANNYLSVAEDDVDKDNEHSLSALDPLEHNLLENKERFRNFFQYAPIGIFQSTPEGKYWGYNARFAEMLGYSLDELSQIDNIADLYLDPEQRDEVKRLLRENDILKDYPIHLRRKDGHDMWMSIYVRTIRDENGQILYFDGFTLDVTRHKNMEQTLRTREEHLSAILKATPDPLVVYNHLGHPEYINPAFTKIFGWSFEELQGQNIPFVPEDQKKVTLAKIKEIYETGEHVFFDTKRFTKDNRLLNIRISAAIIRSSLYQHYGLVVNLTDMTERIQAENEKKKLQHQLLHAQKMESVGRLAGGIAHDLNNMLVAILGYAELLLSNPELEEKFKKNIRQINQAGQSSKNMISQLLAFSRKQTLQFEVLNINKVILDFRGLLEKTIKENISIELSQSVGLPIVEADRSQLEQSILNLAVNAQDAMPNGGKLGIDIKLIELNARDADQRLDLNPGPYVTISVSDTGQGMDKKILEKIFEPFFTTKEVGKGTGLGLSTVYGIVMQHQGNIRVYSEPGRGTSFKIYLPVAEGFFESEQVQDLVDEDNIQGHETVLVVEDNELVLDLTVNVLQDHGYKVLYASSGDQCLEVLSTYQGHLDLMLTDVIMPDTNGKDLYEKVEQVYPGLKVLYMSGYAENIIAHHGILDKDVNFIQKPFTINELAAKLRAIIGSDPK